MIAFKLEHLVSVRWLRPSQACCSPHEVRAAACSQQDVAGRIFVPVQNKPAVRTLVPSLFQLLRHLLSTPTAQLARVPGIYFHKLGTCLFAFVPNLLQPLPPGSVRNRSSQPVVLKHVPNLQALHRYQPVPIGYGLAQLVSEVSSLVPNPYMNPLKSAFCLVTMFTSLALAGQASASTSEFRHGFFEKSRVSDMFSIRSGEEGFQTHIDPNGWFGVLGHNHVSEIAAKDCIPLVCFSENSDGFDGSLDLSMLFDPDQSDVLDIEFRGFVFEFDPISVEWVLDAVEPILAFESGISFSSGSLLAPVEEGYESFVESTHRSLSRTEVKGGEPVVMVAFCFEPRGQGDGVDTKSVVFPSEAAGCQALVIEVAVGVEHDQQITDLYLGGIEPEPVRASHLLSLLVLYVHFDNTLRGMATSPDIVRATPESGESAPEHRKFNPKLVTCEALELSGNVVRGKSWRSGHEYVNMIRHDLNGLNSDTEFGGFLFKENRESFGNTTNKDFASVFWTPNEVVVDVVGRVGTKFERHTLSSCQLLYRRACVIPLEFLNNLGKEDARNSSTG